MSRSRLSVVLVAFAVFASACSSSDDTTPAVDTQTAATVETGRSGSSAGLRDALTAAGIEIIDSPGAVDQVLGLQLWSFQVENMEREIDVGGGIVGFDLDELAGAPSGMPFSYLVAGWITGAGTPAADAASEIMGDQNWEVAPSLVYPTSVLMLFVADSLLAAGIAGESSASPRLVSHSAQQDGICTELSNWVEGALKWIFDGLRIEVAGDEWYAWAANIWNAAVDLAEGAVTVAIEVVTETLLAPLQKALAVIGTVTMVVSSLKTWSFKIIPPDEAPELAVGDEPDSLAAATLLVDTGLPEWPRHLTDCAERAGTPLPDPASAEGSKVTWTIDDDAFPTNRASIVDADETIDDDNTADVTFNPGRDEGEEPFPGWIHLVAVVEKDQVWELRKMLWTLISGRAGEEIGEDYWSPLSRIITTITKPLVDELVKLIAETAGPTRIDVIHHSDVEFEYPLDNLPQVGSDEGLLTSSGFTILEQRYNYLVQTRAREGDLFLREERTLNVVSFDADPTRQSTRTENLGDPQPIEPLGLEGFSDLPLQVEVDRASALVAMNVSTTAPLPGEIAITGEFGRSLSGRADGGVAMSAAAASAGLLFSFTGEPLSVSLFWECGLAVTLEELEDRETKETLYDNRFNDALFTGDCSSLDSSYQGELQPDTVYQLVVSLGLFNERSASDGKVYGNSARVLSDSTDTYSLSEGGSFALVLTPDD